jgi:hypothetical protein
MREARARARAVRVRVCATKYVHTRATLGSFFTVCVCVEVCVCACVFRVECRLLITFIATGKMDWNDEDKIQLADQHAISRPYFTN